MNMNRTLKIALIVVVVFNLVFPVFAKDKYKREYRRSSKDMRDAAIWTEAIVTAGNLLETVISQDSSGWGYYPAPTYPVYPKVRSQVEFGGGYISPRGYEDYEGGYTNGHWETIRVPDAVIYERKYRSPRYDRYGNIIEGGSIYYNQRKTYQEERIWVEHIYENGGKYNYFGTRFAPSHQDRCRGYTDGHWETIRIPEAIVYEQKHRQPRYDRYGNLIEPGSVYYTQKKTYREERIWVQHIYE